MRAGGGAVARGDTEVTGAAAALLGCEEQQRELLVLATRSIQPTLQYFSLLCARVENAVVKQIIECGAALPDSRLPAWSPRCSRKILWICLEIKSQFGEIIVTPDISICGKVIREHSTITSFIIHI